MDPPRKRICTGLEHEIRTEQNKKEDEESETENLTIEHAEYTTSLCNLITDESKKQQANIKAYERLENSSKEANLKGGITAIYTYTKGTLKRHQDQVTNVIKELLKYFHPMTKPTKVSVICDESFSTRINPTFTPEVISVFVDLFKLVVASKSDKVMVFCHKVLGFFVSMYMSFDFVYEIGARYFDVAQQIVFRDELKGKDRLYSTLDTCSLLLKIGEDLNDGV